MKCLFSLIFSLVTCWGQTVSQQVFVNLAKGVSSNPVMNNGQISHQVVLSSTGCTVAGSNAIVTMDASVDNSVWFTIGRTYNYNSTTVASASGAYPYVRLTATLGTNCVASAAYFGSNTVLVPLIAGLTSTGASINALVDALGNVSVTNAGSPVFFNTTANVTGQVLNAVGTTLTIDNIVVGIAGVTSTAVIKWGVNTVLTLDTTAKGVYPINFRCLSTASCTVDTTGGTPANVTVLLSFAK